MKVVFLPVMAFFFNIEKFQISLEKNWDFISYIGILKAGC